jgi:hypothetical protein
MEEALEQERLKLEEVVKMEIKARITTAEQLRELVGAQVRPELGQVMGLRLSLDAAEVRGSEMLL